MQDSMVGTDVRLRTMRSGQAAATELPADQWYLAVWAETAGCEPAAADDPVLRRVRDALTRLEPR